jgi:WD40 repeat protein
VRVWSMSGPGIDAGDTTYESRKSPNAHAGPVESVAASENGHTVVSCAEYDPVVRIWDSAGGFSCREVRVREGVHPQRVAISADGDVVLCAGRSLNRKKCFVGVRDKEQFTYVGIKKRNWVSSVVITRNGRLGGVTCGVYGDWEGKGNRFLPCSVASSHVKLESEHAADAGDTTYDSTLLTSAVEQLFSEAADSDAYRPSLRTSVDYTLCSRDHILILRSEAQYREGRAYVGGFDQPCSCPARARFDCKVKEGATCVIPRPTPNLDLSLRRIAVAGLHDGRIAFMEIVEP